MPTLDTEALLCESESPADRDNPLKVNGKALFTTENHWPFWDFLRAMAAEAGHPVPKERVTVVPTSVYYSFAVVAEWAVWAFSLKFREPYIDLRMVKHLTMTRTFNISKAKERLGS